MTSPNTILNNDWDTNICSKPDFVDDSNSNRSLYTRVISTRLSSLQHNMMGIPIPQHYDPDAHDAYECWIISNTQTDVLNMFKALKKVFSNYQPVQGEENILQFIGGDVVIFNGYRYEIQLVLIMRKTGILAWS